MCDCIRTDMVHAKDGNSYATEAMFEFVVRTNRSIPHANEQWTQIMATNATVAPHVQY